ncbi:MAG: 50S ribosomal protein L17, partial [Chloroflexi bacterium]|nr:50S ribosomal protein L17 [Chloroflexota bacterium]
LRNLSVSVLRYEKVRTTEAKGKEIRRFVDRMILLGKDGSLGARRQALAWLPEPELVDKLFTDLNERFPDRRSGFLRMTRVGHRVGDAAPMIQLELVPSAADERKKKEAAEVEAKPRRRLGLPRRRSAEKKTAEKKTEKAGTA